MLLVSSGVKLLVLNVVKLLVLNVVKLPGNGQLQQISKQMALTVK